MEKENKKDKEYTPCERICVYTPIDIDKELKEMGKTKGISRNKLILNILKEHLGMSI